MLVLPKYIVWVGGIVDYEGDSKAMADAIVRQWIAEGHDDVILAERED